MESLSPTQLMPAPDTTENLDRDDFSQEKGKHPLTPAPKKPGLTAENVNLSQEEFQNLKQQNQSYLFLVESFKTAMNKGESLS